MATSEEEIGKDEDKELEKKHRKGKGNKQQPNEKQKKKEENFNFKEEMENICQHLFTHSHRMEEKQTERIIKAFHKNEKWIDLRGKREDDEMKAMMHKFNKI